MKHFALIGHPLSHSFSKAYFTEKFAREKIDACYENIDIENLAQFLSSLRGAIATKQSIRGFNVTIPYKEAIIPYLDEIDETAQEVGAVNTVKVLPNGHLKGFNTDVIGIEATLSSLRGALATKQSTLVNSGLLRFARNDRGVNALILGTGGASKAVQYILKKHHLPYHLVSRNSNKGLFTYDKLTAEIIKSHLLIINATPVGMAPHINEAPSIPYEAITPQHVLFDLIYNPEETLFLRNGKAKGALTINGLNMLHTQAEASWRIWNQ